MKKCIVLIVLVIITIGVSSCNQIYEDAYQLEHNYKLCREKNWSDSLMYKTQFIELYKAMTYSEQKQYKKYRDEKNMLKAELDAVNAHNEKEAIGLLNE